MSPLKLLIGYGFTYYYCKNKCVTVTSSVILKLEILLRQKQYALGSKLTCYSVEFKLYEYVHPSPVLCQNSLGVLWIIKLSFYFT